jgi:NADH-quinone oxidoreductase E subunit
MPLTDETRLAAREIIARYPRSRSALLPMLHLVQSEDGYVSPEGVRFCAEELGLTKAEVGAVATFYTMYKRRPAGEYLVSVCTNTLCDVLGGQEIYETLSESLGVGHDETTADGRITLEHAECLAACDYAPVVTVNYEFFDQQTVGSATELVGELQAGRRPLPTRGAPLCTFKEISRQLAGFPDTRPGAVDAGGAGEPTLVGARLAVQRGETAPAYDAPRPLDEPAASNGAAAQSPAPAAAAGAGAPPAPAAPATGERATPAAAPTTAAERSAEAGTARYGGPADQPSSGGGEGGQGLETSASDPAASPGSGVTHEADAAKAPSAAPDAPTADGPEVGSGRRPATGPTASGGTAGTDTGTAGSATTETEPGRPGPDGAVAPTPPAGEAGSGGDASQDPAAPAAAPDRPRPTNRGRKTRREG